MGFPSGAHGWVDRSKQECDENSETLQMVYADLLHIEKGLAIQLGPILARSKRGIYVHDPNVVRAVTSPVSSCVSMQLSMYGTGGKFGRKKRSVRVARDTAESNSSYLGSVSTVQMLHMSMNSANV